MARRKPPTIAAHPGEILRTEFIEPMGITAYQLAKALALPWNLRDSPRTAGHQRRCRVAPRQVLWHDAAVLDKSATDYDLRLASACAPLGKIKPRSAA
jgi:antitoxin HigA-1